jgi:hypothetical protein
LINWSGSEAAYLSRIMAKLLASARPYPVI